MYNKIIRKIIGVLFSTMRDNTRTDIFHKYETVADIAYQLPYIDSETHIKDLSMRVKK